MKNVKKSVLLSLIKKFKGKKILVVGDLMVDEYIWGNVSRISPEAPIPVVEVKKEEAKPGGAANVILNLISLGAKVYAAGVVGADANANKLKSYLKKDKVDLAAVITDNTRPTTIKTRVFAHHQQVVRIDKEKKLNLSGKVVEKILAQIEKIMPQLDAIIFSDYDKGVLTPALVEGIIKVAKGKIITVDPKPANIKIFQNVTLIAPNKKEAAEGAGISIKTEADVLKAAHTLTKMTHAETILITRGEEGMSLFEKGKLFHVPTVAREVYDVTGAGDTVISVVTLALTAGAAFKEASKLSNIAAGKVVAEVGVVTLTPNALAAAVNETE